VSDVHDLLDQLRNEIAELGDMLAERLPGFREARAEVEAEELAATRWQEFVAAHPELTDDETRAPLTFTDDELLAAVPEAIRRSNDLSRWIVKVLADLGDREWADSADVVRVGRALGRLSREGRVRRVPRPSWDHGPAEWQPCPDREQKGGDDG
jgi:hypothetical protein